MKKNKSKQRLLILCLVVLIIIALIYAFIYASVNIKFIDKYEIEYGDTIDASALVSDYNAIEVEYPTIDTSEVKELELEYVLHSNLISKTVVHKVNVVDSQKPIIELFSDKVEIRPDEDFDPKANVKKAYDVVDGNLDYVVEGAYNVSEVGTYTLSVKATDKNQNSTEINYTLEVSKPKLEVIDGVTYVDGIMIVNKQYGLPEDYGFEDPVAREHLDELRADAEEAGYYLPIISGFRDYDYQYDVYWGWVALDGQELADTYSARPGYSEHQTGLTWDIGLLEDWFGETDAGIWLEEHCADYGFIIRYPLGKEDITGYKYEPWHVRYVGEEHSHKIMDSGLCLEEYLGLVD